MQRISSKFEKIEISALCTYPTKRLSPLLKLKIKNYYEIKFLFYYPLKQNLLLNCSVQAVYTCYMNIQRILRINIIYQNMEKNIILIL